jgi:hypothetical protein
MTDPDPGGPKHTDPDLQQLIKKFVKYLYGEDEGNDALGDAGLGQQGVRGGRATAQRQHPLQHIQRCTPQHRVHTEWQPPLFWRTFRHDGKICPGGGAGGATPPPPFHHSHHHLQSCSVRYGPAEWADTVPQYIYSVGNSVVDPDPK